MGGEDLKVVKIVLDDNKYALYVQNMDGVPLRSVNLIAYDIITLHICPKEPYTVLIELPKSYDLVSVILCQ